jgi:hypothetical protein
MCAVDDYTDMSWVHFARSNFEITMFISTLIKVLKGKGIKTEFIQYNNAGEHMGKLKEFCNIERIELKYMAPASPRQNGRVEKKIHIIWQRNMTMMLHEQLTKKIQANLWTEAVNTSCFLENIILKPQRDKPTLES